MLGGVREDLGCYIEVGEDVEEGRTEPFDRFSDLLEHVSRELVDQLAELVAHLQKVVAVDNVHPGLLLFLARIYQALPRITPAMRLCVDEKRCAKSAAGKGQVLSLKVEAKLGRESERLFLVWSKIALARFGQQLESGLASDVLQQLPAWDKVVLYNNT